jgi:hypothetical protein
MDIPVPTAHAAADALPLCADLLLSYRFAVFLAKERGSHQYMNINIRKARGGHLYGNTQGVVWCESAAKLCAAVCQLLPAAHVLTAQAPFGLLSSGNTVEWQSILAIKAACAAAAPPIAFDPNAFTQSDCRDVLINGRPCQLKGSRRPGPGASWNFELVRLCCRGVNDQTSKQPYTVTDPIAYFVLVAFEAAVQGQDPVLYGFRIISRLQAIEIGLLANPAPPIPQVGRKWLYLDSNFAPDAITAVR